MSEVNKDVAMTHTFQLVGNEVAEFNRAFELSGFRSKSEFIRFMLFEAIKDYYKGKDHE